MLEFGHQRVLAVKRFDRRWIGTPAEKINKPGYTPAPGAWIARLPQEDFCQATGRSPTERYEADGGPSIDEILEILRAGESPDLDRAHFVLAQLAFWLLAGTGGHGKNFSLHQRAGGAFGLTPFYDVLSAWPIIGHGANKLPLQDAKLAMSVRGKSKHYRLREIQPRHWHDLAGRVGIPGLWHRMIELTESAAGNALEQVTADLPPGFPSRVSDAIAAGVRQQSRIFLKDARRV